ncbi:MFS transporter [Shewanella algae]|uniref:MFS transporter n=1 Tax=Shewanella algae TaxID=38313 RepID=UPI002935C562|nr:MFS transporter [Shewanella algae]MDV2963481.1 MFS transporter [Shewanella algae]
MSKSLPFSIYLLALGIFSLISCELQVLGMMPQLSASLSLSVSEVGYLVSFYAGAMALAGPVLTLCLSGRPPKQALLILYSLFLLAQGVAIMAQDYWLLVVTRIIIGAAAGAFFGITVGRVGELVPEAQKMRAIAVLLAGIMLGTILGLPMASLSAEYFGWRTGFFLVLLCGLMAALLSVRFLPSLPSQPPLPLKEELKAFASARLWAIYATSFCIIGTTYAAFSYFVPILSELAGFSSQTITLLLFGYGLSMLLGNHLVSRFCGRNDLTLQALGLLLQALFLLLLAQGSEYPLLAAVAVLGIGFSGVSMNPAMVSRLMQLPQGSRALVNTVHTSVITLGVMGGSFISGYALARGANLYAPIWIAMLIALLGLLSLGLPRLLSASSRAEVPCAEIK